MPAGSIQNLFVGNITPCPTCGRACEVVPGVYDMLPDGINILIDPSISPEALAALKKLAERVQSKDISASEAQGVAEKIVPGTGKLFDISNWSENAQATVLNAIILAASGILAASIGAAALIATSGDSGPHTHSNHVVAVEKSPEPAREKAKRNDRQKAKRYKTNGRYLNSTAMTPIPKPKPKERQ